MDDSGRPLALTSHTLAAVPIAIGGKGLPDGVVFRDDMPDAGMQLLSEGTCAFHSLVMAHQIGVVMFAGSSQHQ